MQLPGNVPSNGPREKDRFGIDDAHGSVGGQLEVAAPRQQPVEAQHQVEGVLCNEDVFTLMRQPYWVAEKSSRSVHAQPDRRRPGCPAGPLEDE